MAEVAAGLVWLVVDEAGVGRSGINCDAMACSSQLLASHQIRVLT